MKPRIEGKHLDSQGLAYARGSATGRAARVVVAVLKEELGRQGVAVSFTEAKRGEKRIPAGLIRKAAGLSCSEAGPPDRKSTHTQSSTTVTQQRRPNP